MFLDAQTRSFRRLRFLEPSAQTDARSVWKLRPAHTPAHTPKPVSLFLVGRVLNRVKAVLVVDGLCFLSVQESQPFRGYICVRSIGHDPTHIGRCGVLICGYDDALNRITNDLLKPEEGARVRISTRRWLAELAPALVFIGS
jgi:hypothetical protein